MEIEDEMILNKDLNALVGAIVQIDRILIPHHSSLALDLDKVKQIKKELDSLYERGSLFLEISDVVRKFEETMKAYGKEYAPDSYPHKLVFDKEKGAIAQIETLARKAYLKMARVEEG